MTDETSVQETAPVENVPAVEEVVSDEATPETKAVADSTPAPEAGETPAKKPDGFSKRIDELTRDYYAERREREAAEREARTLREQIEALRPKPVELPKGPPQLSDYQFDEEKHRQATLEYVRSEAQRVAREELQSERTRQQAQAKEAAFAQRETEYAKKSPEYKAKVNDPRLAISNVMRDLIMESDLGPQVAEHLADNPELAAQIYKLSAVSAAKEIGRIEAKLDRPAAPVIVPKVSSAPPPPSKLEAVDAAPPKSIDDPKISDAEFARIRRRQIAQRR